MAKTAKKKTKKWIKFRHRVVRNIAYCIIKPYGRLKYGMRVQKFKEQEKRPYVILLNHQTPFDQLFVGLAFKGPVYYLATEDIFSNGFVSSLIKYLVAPIPIKKQTVDVRAVLNCMRVAKEGGTICIAPEGNRTYSGRTEYINPAIVKLCKNLKLPIALFRIEGGYGVQPRWSDVVRKGKMKGYVARVLQPEEYEKLTEAELLAAIKDGLYVDEAKADGEFRHKKRAEYLERAVYVCPYCGLSAFESRNDTVTCKKCGRQVRYQLNKELQGVGFEFPYKFVAEWYDAQSEFIRKLDLSEYVDEPAYREEASVSEVIPCKKKVPLYKNAKVALYGDRIEIESGTERLRIPFDEATAASVLGRNKLNVYHGGKIYQLKGDKRFNALKYVHIYYRFKNIRKGENDEQFLGL